MSKLTDFLTNYDSNEPTIAKSFRLKRLKRFLEMIESVYEVKGSVSVLDIGGTADYWKIVDEEYFLRFKVRITLLNLPGDNISSDSDIFEHIDGDATDFIWEKFDQCDYDLIHSNSVLEHVGDWYKMKIFAQNITSFHGGYFVQTPNYWFPIEPHSMTLFFHWLPKPMRVFLVRKTSLGHWQKADSVSEAVDIVESARMLNRTMFSDLFKNADIISEKFFLMTKSLIALKEN